MKHALLILAMVCASMFTGCISGKVGAALGAKVFEGILEGSLNPAFDLAYASNEFRVAKLRWPEDYDELSSFLKGTDGRTYSSLQAVEYHRIKFTRTADGNLRIDADYTLNSAGKLNWGGTYRANGRGSLDGMVVSPFDPHEMMPQPNPKGGA